MCLIHRHLDIQSRRFPIVVVIAIAEAGITSATILETSSGEGGALMSTTSFH